MAKFTIRAVKPITNEEHTFVYDNLTSEIFDEQGNLIKVKSDEQPNYNAVFALSLIHI